MQQALSTNYTKSSIILDQSFGAQMDLSSNYKSSDSFDQLGL